MSKTCSELFADTNAIIIGDANVEVKGIAYRSDAVKDGDAFFCIVGLKSDGHSFAEDAIKRGASVIVCERELELSCASNVVFVIVDDTRAAMAQASCCFYDFPSSSFKLVGITGTNGKTTTTYLVEKIASTCGLKTGIIGTIGMKIGDEIIDCGRTTPESPDLQRMLANLRDEGCELVAMEVSSHALDLKRVWGCDFAVTAFTNLSQDHLDYHETLDAYYDAKALLFGKDYPAKRVVGTSTEWGEKLAEMCETTAQDLLTYGFSDTDDIHPLCVQYDVSGTEIELASPSGQLRVTSPLVGKFNVENVMCAFGIGLQLGLSQDDLASALSQECSVPGRLERVVFNDEQIEHLYDCDAAYCKLPSVYVDYAHTPDAITKALASVKALSKGKTIIVFGCGGDRDREKRPLMGRAALEADYAIVTSDNPRTEKPDAIIADIVAGMEDVPANTGKASSSPSLYEVIADRACAIMKAIEIAGENDVVLIAGKGHEDYQEIAGEKIHFDDREQARAAMFAKANNKDVAGGETSA